MNTSYEPSEGIYVGRPPCANCQAAYRLHRDGGCPVAYRPGTLVEARNGLERAEQAGDPEAMFIARGELQRIVGR